MMCSRLLAFTFCASFAGTSLAEERRPQVYKEKIAPHWFANGTKFWYRNVGPEGSTEFILVDAEKGTRAPAFDHARAAEFMSKTLAKQIDAQHLPVLRLDFQGDDQIKLEGTQANWVFNFVSQEWRLLENKSASQATLNFNLEPRPSRDGGQESEIQFINELDEELELYWLDTERVRVPYGSLKPKQTKAQHTFAGHIWLLSKMNGEIAAVFEAGEVPARAIIDGRASQRTAPREGRRRRGPANGAEAASSVQSPDGKWEAYVYEHNLWLRGNNGQSFPLTFDGSQGDSYRKDASRSRLLGMNYETPDFPASLPDVYWSPDSAKLVAMRTRQVAERRVYLVESSPKDQLQPKLQSYPYLKPGDEIPTQRPRLFQVAEKREIALKEELFSQPWDCGDVRWEADSSRFTFFYNQRGHQVMRILAVETSGTVSCLVEEKSQTFIDQGKLYTEHLPASTEILWASERDGWNHLWLYDAKTGAVKNQVTHGLWLVQAVDAVDHSKRQVEFRALGIRSGQDPYHVHYARINLDGSGLIPLTEGDGTHSLSWSPDHRFYIDSYSRVDLPPVHELRRGIDGQFILLLEQADASEILSTGQRWPERFVAKGRDGVTDIHGIIHRPRNFDPAKKYPVIENIYAGPHGFHVPKAFRAAWRQEALLDRGFIVVQIDGMGTSGRSKSFHDVCWKNLVDAGLPDRIAWMKAAAATRPEMDLARVGIFGGSAGGQNALSALLTHGEVYRAAVADCGCHDNRMDKIWWNEQWMGWPIGPHYHEQSNVTLAHKLEGKLMLIVGELDKNVDPASTMQVANALVKADKDFDLVIIPGVGHGAASGGYGQRRLVDFFARHLLSKTSSPPANSRS